ncbi:MAG TPA: GatB/YqeY domain-containing protein [Candidatus Dormibacteraeota bacterium]
MTLLERVEADMFDARKKRDELAVNTLGVLKSELVKAGKEPGAGGRLDDPASVRVVRREVKRREEAAEAYRSAGRADSAEREEREAELLRGYLPAAISPAELEAEVRRAIEEVGPAGPGGFGAVMKVATSRLAGRAEGGEIAATVRRLLGQG